MDEATVNKNHFTVTIDTKNGATLNPEIANVTVDANEGNILIVELSNEVMYNDDTVKVSYTPGTLTTLDAVAATTITDAVLTDFIKTNLFEDSAFSAVDYSFETTEDANWPYLGWNGRWGEYEMNLSFNQAYHGSESMYIEMNPNGGMIIGNVDGNADNVTFPVETGFTYEMGAWFYVEEKNDVSGEANIRMYWRPGTNWGIGDNVTFNDATPVGEWFYSSAKVVFSGDADISYMIRGVNSNSTALKFYMDNLTLFKLTARP